MLTIKTRNKSGKVLATIPPGGNFEGDIDVPHVVVIDKKDKDPWAPSAILTHITFTKPMRILDTVAVLMKCNVMDGIEFLGKPGVLFLDDHTLQSVGNKKRIKNCAAINMLSDTFVRKYIAAHGKGVLNCLPTVSSHPATRKRKRSE